MVSTRTCPPYSAATWLTARGVADEPTERTLMTLAPASNSMRASLAPPSTVLESARIGVSPAACRKVVTADRPKRFSTGVPTSMMSTSQPSSSTRPMWPGSSMASWSSSPGSSGSAPTGGEGDVRGGTSGRIRSAGVAVQLLLIHPRHGVQRRSRQFELQPGPVGQRAHDGQVERADVLDLAVPGHQERLIVAGVDDVGQVQRAGDARGGFLGVPEDGRVDSGPGDTGVVQGVAADQVYALVVGHGEADAAGGVTGQIHHPDARDQLFTVLDLPDVHPLEEVVGPGRRGPVVVVGLLAVEPFVRVDDQGRITENVDVLHVIPVGVGQHHQVYVVRGQVPGGQRVLEERPP